MTDELGASLQHMDFVQLVLLFGFLTSYVLALGRLFGARVRWRSALLAVLCAAGFASRTVPWEHGAMLVVFVIGALGLFVAATWLMAVLLAPQRPVSVPEDSQLANALAQAGAMQRSGAVDTVPGAAR